MHQSIATIDSPEFINLQPLDINPLMSSCQIKVLYVGENRNHSVISKEVAAEMAKTLRGAPIVGYYKENAEDFGDHGQRVTIDDEGVHFDCLTVPYGFVAPDAKVWFQVFEDEDESGVVTKREYLMTNGFLWTGQFPECNLAVSEGRPQSMELDEKSLSGYWSTNHNNNIDFFIINDAIFSKLCILGEDVEPCFEGASVSASEVKEKFTLDNSFKNTLFSMMQDLKNFALGGGQTMEIEKIENAAVEEKAVEENFTAQDETVESTAAEIQNTIEESPSSEEPVAEFKKEEEDEKEEKKDTEDKEESDSEEEDDKKKKEEEYACGGAKEKDDEAKKKYELLESQYTELQNKYSALEAQYNELVEFKNSIESAKKDELINSFTSLTEEEKKDVIENKASYSYTDIENKLSVIYTRKAMAAEKQQAEEEHKEEPVTLFSLTGDCGTGYPDWFKAVKATQDKM